jgi:hypothetical protein
MDQLCAQLSAADLTSLERFDQLARAVSLATPLAYAFQPPDDIMARVDYILQRIVDLTTQYDIRLPPPMAPGWPAVFSAVRFNVCAQLPAGAQLLCPHPLCTHRTRSERAPRVTRIIRPRFRPFLQRQLGHQLWHLAHLWLLLPAASKATGLAPSPLRRAIFSLPTFQAPTSTAV